MVVKIPTSLETTYGDMAIRENSVINLPWKKEERKTEKYQTPHEPFIKFPTLPGQVTSITKTHRASMVAKRRKFH